MGILMDVIKAFAVGGAFCVIGQILLDKTSLTPARILVGYVVAGVILGAIGLYAPLAEFAGAGATTPLTGFGFLISKGVRSAVDERGLLGALTGPLSAASAGIFLGLIASECFRYGNVRKKSGRRNPEEPVVMKEE